MWLSDYVPPIFAVLDHILDHLVVVTFKLIVLLIVEEAQRFDPIVYCEHSEIFVDLLKYLLNLQNLFDIDLNILGPRRLILTLFTIRYLFGIIVPYCISLLFSFCGLWTVFVVLLLLSLLNKIFLRSQKRLVAWLIVLPDRSFVVISQTFL